MKRKEPRSLYDLRACFRWVKPAASLKRLLRAAGAPQHAFPLGKTGGLIEAQRSTLASYTNPSQFPLGKTGGLIEARVIFVQHRKHIKFPLGKTGGLIEAGTTDELRRRRASGFRWVKPAASLKQIEDVMVRHDGMVVSAG